MDKEKFIADLYETRLDTIRWVGVIKLLSSDLPIKKYDFQLNLIDTSFGKWFYEKLSIISLSNCETVIHDIEATLIIMHQNFLVIYDICVIHRQKKFMGIKKSLTAQERKICSEHYLKVLSASDKFQRHLRTLQKIIDAQEIEEIVLPTEEEKKEEIMTSLEESNEKAEEKKVLLSGARGAYLE